MLKYYHSNTNGEKIIKRVFESTDIEKLVHFTRHCDFKIEDDTCYNEACTILRQIKAEFPNSGIRKETPTEGGFYKWYVEERCLLEHVLFKAMIPKYCSLYLKSIDNNKPIFINNHEELHKNKLQQCKTYKLEWLEYIINILENQIQGKEFKNLEEVLRPFMLANYVNQNKR